MQLIEPQYFWGIMFFVAAFATGKEMPPPPRCYSIRYRPPASAEVLKSRGMEPAGS